MKGYATPDVAKLLGISIPQVRAFARSGFPRPATAASAANSGSPSPTSCCSAPPRAWRRRACRRAASSARCARSGASCPRAARSRRCASRPRATGCWCATGPRRGTRSRGRSRWISRSPSWRAGRRRWPGRRARAARAAAEPLDADEWYDLGFDLEAVDLEEARDAYRRALELAPDHADAHVNLGRLLQEGGDAARSRRPLPAGPRAQRAARDGVVRPGHRAGGPAPPLRRHPRLRAGHRHRPQARRRALQPVPALRGRGQARRRAAEPQPLPPAGEAQRRLNGRGPRRPGAERPGA